MKLAGQFVYKHDPMDALNRNDDYDDLFTHAENQDLFTTKRIGFSL